MPSTILMPALSPTMESGQLARWTVREGDAVRSGDVVAEIETDKTTMEVLAAEDGVLGRILVADGTPDVAINSPIGILLLDGEDTSALPDGTAAAIDASASVASTSSLSDAADSKTKPPSPAKQTAGHGPADSPKQSAPHDTEVPEGTQMLTQSVREALRDAMAEAMRADDRVFVMGEEVAEYQGAYKVTQGLLDEFGGRRVIDTPITEHGFAGLGVGAAFRGLRPVVEFMTFNFAMQAIDHIINSAAKTLYMSGGQMGCPIVFRGPNGAAARVGAQHSQDYASWYAHVPGLKVVQPYTAADAKGLLRSAIEDPNPVIVLENELLYGREFDVPDLPDWRVPLGRARIARIGDDVTLVSFGIGMSYAMEAADALADKGIQAEVIDLRTLRPMDTGTVVESVRKTNRCVTVEEGWPVCSIGSEISAVLMSEAFDWLDAPVTRVTGLDVPMPYAANLERLALPSVSQVVEAALSVCYRK